MKKILILANFLATVALLGNAQTNVIRVTSWPTESWPGTEMASWPVESWPGTEMASWPVESWPVESWPDCELVSRS